MSSRALDLRYDYDGASPELSLTAVPRKRSSQAAAVSTRLLDYWRSTLPLPVAARRRALDAACVRARRDRAASADVVSFALGDTDEEIVYRATLEHLACGHRAGLNASASARDALEWVARRLSLNRAGVFAALASLDDQSVLEMLLPFRLVLDEAECAAVHRRLQLHPAGPTREFLRAWAEVRDPIARHSLRSIPGG